MNHRLILTCLVLLALSQVSIGAALQETKQPAPAPDPASASTTVVTEPGDPKPPPGFFEEGTVRVDFDASRPDHGVPFSVAIDAGKVISTRKYGGSTDYAKDSPDSSLFSDPPPHRFVLSFDSARLGGFPTRAGLVFTDLGHSSGGMIIFEAWSGPNCSGKLLASVKAFRGKDGTYNRNFGDDSFFGIRNVGPIGSVHMTSDAKDGGMEADVLYYGSIGEPQLKISASLPVNDKILEVGHPSDISVTVSNTGNGTAHGVRVVLDCSGPPVGDHCSAASQEIGTLERGQSRTASLTLNLPEEAWGGMAELKIRAVTTGGLEASTFLQVTIKPRYSKPPYPADLAVEEVKFVEPSANQALDGYESGEIRFSVVNRGRGAAQNVQISLSPISSADGLRYDPSKVVEKIEPKQSVPVSFAVSAAGNVQSAPRNFRIQAAEEFGFDADPMRIAFETRAFEAPDLKIEKVAINDGQEGDAYGNGNSIIEPNESVVVTAFVQNLGAGAAADVKARIVLEGNDPNISCPDSGKVVDVGTIAPGDYKPVSFYFFTSKRYAAAKVPIKVALTESKGDFGKTLDLGLAMNQRTPNVVDVKVARIEMPKPEVKPIAEAFRSDVDQVPASSRMKRPEGFAVIIGIEKYKYAPKVSFAERDAAAFYNYTLTVLGIPERNIYYLVNEGATSGEFKKLFSEDGWIGKRVTRESDVFVYYSGHGAPGLEDRRPYLIPYDIDPNYASTGILLDQMYQTLGALNAKSMTLMLDACFSGQTREKEALLAGARPVAVNVKGPQVQGRLTVLAAAGGSEISSSYPEQQHGMFNYFLLKGLRGDADADKNMAVTVKELFDYVRPNVSRVAGTHDREQTPTLSATSPDTVVVAY